MSAIRFAQPKLFTLGSRRCRECQHPRWPRISTARLLPLRCVEQSIERQLEIDDRMVNERSERGTPVEYGNTDWSTGTIPEETEHRLRKFQFAIHGRLRSGQNPGDQRAVATAIGSSLRIRSFCPAESGVRNHTKHRGRLREFGTDLSHITCPEAGQVPPEPMERSVHTAGHWARSRRFSIHCWG